MVVLLLGGPIGGTLVVIGVDLTRVVMTVFTRAKLAVVVVRALSQRVRHRACQSVRVVFPVTDSVRQRKNDCHRSEQGEAERADPSAMQRLDGPRGRVHGSRPERSGLASRPIRRRRGVRICSPPIFALGPLNRAEHRRAACPTRRVVVPDGDADPFIFGRVHGVLAVRVFE